MTDTKLTLRKVVGDGRRLVAGFVRAHPVAFFLAVAGAALFAASIVASAMVIGWVTDTVLLPVLGKGEARGNRLLGAILAVAGVALWKAIGTVVRRAGATWVQYRTRADVRANLIDHQLALDLAWYEDRSTGDLLAVSEADTLQGTWVLGPLPYATGSTLLFLASGAIITMIDPLLGLVAVLFLGLVIAVDIVGGWITFHRFEAVQEAKGAVGRIAHESLDGALTVRALGRESEEIHRLAVAVHQLREAQISVGRLFASFRAVTESLPAMCVVVALVVGVIRIDQGALTTGELVTVAYLVSLLTIPMRLIGFVLWAAAQSTASWERVQRILDADDFVRHGTRSAVDDPTGGAVDADDVSFSYVPGTRVLTAVDLEITPGRTVAIVGATGSGKSTIAKLMVRLWDPDSGAIHLDRRDLRSFARTELASEVALVAQDGFLFDDTVDGNITLGLPVGDDEVVEALRLAGATEFVTALPDGRETRIGERGLSLSGGQRQRISLARALVRRPRLLVLDDATSAVDPSVEVEILRGLRRAELPATVVIVAYRRSSITLADEVVYVEDGRISDHGPHDELLRRSPGYSRLLVAYEEDAARRSAERGEVSG
ncbi:MAG: ABC transporter ATP-binding protein [Acidimicrobiia bacterium]